MYIQPQSLDKENPLKLLTSFILTLMKEQAGCCYQHVCIAIAPDSERSQNHYCNVLFLQCPVADMLTATASLLFCLSQYKKIINVRLDPVSILINISFHLPAGGIDRGLILH